MILPLNIFIPFPTVVKRSVIYLYNHLFVKNKILKKKQLNFKLF